MSYKLLLADDSVTIQRVVELTFSGEDVQVVAVGDGEQAIARIQAERPDIVLADIGMPKRSGYEVAAFVKEHPELSHIPVLLLAGAFEPVDEARAKQVQCDGVLVKPFEPQQVIARVRELIERHKATSAGSGTRESVETSEPPQLTLAARAPGPESPRVPGPGAPDSSLDEYFDRLDAAFATLGNAQMTDLPGVLDTDDIFGREVSTIDDVLGGTPLQDPAAALPSIGRVAPPSFEPPDTTPTLAPAARPRAVRASTAGDPIADVFNLLFAVEQGEADASTVRVGPQAAPVAITDELVDQLTRRVLERVGPDALKAAVADVVSDVAERLVREEIERIRRANTKA